LVSVPLLVHPRYEAGAELGRGAQGVVLRVVDREAPARALVAKVWRATRAAESAIEAEFRLLRRLDVPGLARAHDFGRDERSQAPFFVEDFIAGQTAGEFVAAGADDRAERLFRVLAEVATTLAALHEAAFVHGDLKPEHVRVTAEGRVYLLDLGAAVAATQASSDAPAILTPAFAAPELLAGERPSPLSDLFSLGALAWCVATGSSRRRESGRLRSQASWVPPSLADLVERLLQSHPRDRPASAETVLGALGVLGLASARKAAPAPVGREHELQALARPSVGVRYLVGPSGVGKSHLLREVVTRALLDGRSARRIAFPRDEALLVSELVAFLRGSEAAWPFTAEPTGSAPMLLVLDELQRAPVELVAALDSYRCRPLSGRALDVIGALREAPDGAERITLGALEEPAFVALCQRLGVHEPAAVAELNRVTQRNPGWLVAACGRVPLTRDMVLERTRELSRPALDFLALVALFGGVVERPLAEQIWGSASAPREISELLLAGLITRRATGGVTAYALYAPELHQEVAASVGSFDLAERAAAAALAYESPTSRALLALTSSPFPPNSREALLERAAEVAERAGLLNEHIEALFALASRSERRTAELLTRLERLTRSSGINHPEVLAWLNQAALAEPKLAPLALRRQAEQAARTGDFELAERHAKEAQERALMLGDRLAEALALGTRGAVALFRADVAGAESALRDARARLTTLDVPDLEELARVDHNVGVVALYRDRVDDAVEAFERSLRIKRRLGDRAGVRSCLLNLGLALARQRQYEAAARSVTGAHALALALHQHAGRAWCLAARADVEVRRGNARDAERFIAEAEAISQAPPSVRADLCLLRGQLALAAGDGGAARLAVEALDPVLREHDTMIDARARVVEAGALLACLPADPRGAARLALKAARAARQGRLTEVEQQALELLGAARKRGRGPELRRYTASVDGDAALWSWLAAVSSGAQAESPVDDLLRALRAMSGAERVLLVVCRGDGSLERAWGVDLEGFALPAAIERCDPAFVRAALEAGAPLYQRDIVTVAGRGARLALPVPGLPTPVAVLVLEQRFRPNSFDALAPEQAKRFGMLAGLALRLAPRSSLPPSGVLEAPPREAPQAATQQSEQSTAVPTSGARRQFAEIVGASRALERALYRLDAAIDSDLPVLIVGETGTGKELFARALHHGGERARAPLVALNCAAIPEALFEAELFGHARGAFTGADRARGGLLAQAEGGTLFLDEIAELPLPRQATLLRVLETRRFRPIGSDDERTCDVRIVAATNRPLELEVQRGTFRQDLLYRINVIEIRVPPLRERHGDVPRLVRSFLERENARVSFSADAMSALDAHTWPGNVRELEHQVQRLLTLGLERIGINHLPRVFRQRSGPRPALPIEAPGPQGERAEVERALQRAHGNLTHAARALGITRHGLKKRMLRLGLRAASSLGGQS
jgi:DNA-binding NtrC family response regulator/tRNA A-37 threonylcarbamoyl transferase component Bud32/tetratricopeptide (TPR) repeat protein